MFLADGNGTFTQAMDLELDGTGFGLGKRSQRYAMVVEDGEVSCPPRSLVCKLALTSLRSMIESTV